MIVDLKWLKIHPRESETFHLMAKGQNTLVADMGAEFLEPVDVDLTIENTGSLYVGRGKLSTRLLLTCGRCLEKFVFPIEVKLDFLLGETASLHAANQDEYEAVIVVDNQADISPVTQAAIITAIPLVPLCKSQCRGLCPVCGANRNKVDCTCEQKDIDPRWEALKKLR